jgi:hypothetical protein
MTIGEGRLMDAVFQALRSYFASPEYETWLEEAYAANQRPRAQAAKRDDAVARLEAAVAAAEARGGRVTESLAQIGFSEPLAAKLRTEEAKLLSPAREPLSDVLAQAAGRKVLTQRRAEGTTVEEIPRTFKRAYWRTSATRMRSSAGTSWSAAILPVSICTHSIVPVNVPS